MIQDKLNPYWGFTIKEIIFDLHSHQIRIEIFESKGNNTTINFSEVSGHYFDYIGYGESDKTITEWEVIELAEFYYLPELKNKKVGELLSNTISFNFLIEIYSSKLYIKSNHLFINNEKVI